MTEIEILQQILETNQNIETLSTIIMTLSVFNIGLYVTERIRKLKESRLK